MPDPAARLLSLLSLLQTPRDWPGAELAARLGVTHRTIRRDIERLRKLGYPVEATLGVFGGYRLAAGAAMPPLLLENDEAVALVVGLRACASQAVAGIDEAAVRALTKVARVLPARVRQQVTAIGSATVVLTGGPGPAADPDVLTVLGAAATNHERVRMHYRPRTGPATARHIEPQRLVSAGRRWYLIAFDLDRQDWRTFRADRINDPQATGGRAAHHDIPGGDVQRFLTENQYALAPVHHADITLALPADDALARLGDALADGRFDPLGLQQCRWHTHPDTLDWLTLRLLQLDCDFTIHHPPELTEHLHQLKERLHRSAP